MKAFIINLNSPINAGAVVVAEEPIIALRTLMDELNLIKSTCKYQIKEIKWVRTELYNKPEVLFTKALK